MTARRPLLASGLALALSAGLLVASAGTAAAAAISVNSLADTTANDGSCTLREAIIAANTETASGGAVGECAAGSGNDTISFTVTGTIPIGGELIVTDADGLRIQGPGMNLLTLDGGGADRVLVSNGPLVLDALTVTNGDSVSDGGGIKNNSTLTITNSRVSSNTASGVGGGIDNDGGILAITSSTISGNTAGGDGGGGIFNDAGTLMITNSTLSTNTTTSDGGGIKNDLSGTVTITNSTVSGNSAGGDGGGGIDNDGTVTITDSTFSGNSATGVGGDGGGIYNNLDDDAVLDVTNSTFSGNSATGAGGAIYNDLDDDTSTTGGATLRNTTVSGNTASGDGGGGIFTGAGTLTITDSTVSGNTASGEGGGILNGTFPNDSTLILTDSTVSDNSAGGDGGGGIFNDAGTLTITDSTISDNTADEDGGGIKNDGGGTVTIANSTFSGNSANGVGGPDGGGGIDNDGDVTITNSTFSGNSAVGDGGAIYNNLDDDGTLDVTNSTFSGNSAGGTVDDDSGGAISNRLSPGDSTTGGATLRSTIVANNDAERGGGVFTNGGTLTITNSRVPDNTASGEGGGILNDGSANDSTLILTNSTVSGNTAGGDGGGGIFSDSAALTTGTVTITDSTVSGNTADEDGGGLKNDNGGTVTITTSTFSGNTANGDGGGGIDNDGDVMITNSTFSGNTANGGSGGGINNNLDDDAVLDVTYSTFSGNTANGGSGGGIYNIASGGPTTGGATLRSTIVAHNPGGNCAGVGITDAGYNLSSDSSCGLSGTSLSNTDPELEPLANNGGPTRTMALPESSPAADVIPEGQPSGAGCGTTIDTDQRGVTRPQEDGCEIGAYEIQDQVPQPPPFVAPPDAISMSPTSGPIGTIVTITGTNLANAMVRFNGIVAQVQTNTPTQIVVTVPAGATTGPVTVSTSGGSDVAGTFTVTPPVGPSVTGFTPTKGKVGTQVVITGSGFTGTAVSFGGVSAPFVVDSPTQITATVPAHAGTGPIVVTTEQGTGTSAGEFVVTHARSVGLHVSAPRGSVGVADGFSACASGVLLRLQLQVAGGFSTVDSTTTSAHGAYRFGGVREPGSYRVVAKKVTLASGDVCLKATSSVVSL